MASSMTARPCSLLGSKPRIATAFSTSLPRRTLARGLPVVTQASAETAFALTQQAIAFVAVVGAEAAYTGLNTPADTKGRPEVPTVLGGVGATLAALVLVQQQSPLDSVGYGIGFAASVYLFANFLQRTKDTVQKASDDWPGPKAWPAVMSLIAFFSLAAFLQALLPSLGLK